MHTGTSVVVMNGKKLCTEVQQHNEHRAVSAYNAGLNVEVWCAAEYMALYKAMQTPQ